MAKAKILIITRCWDCYWLTVDPNLCWEPERKKKEGVIVNIENISIIDPGCLLQDADKPQEIIQNKLERLDDFISMLEYWLNWNQKDRDNEDLETTDDTNIICVPPEWPSRGIIKKWIQIMKSFKDADKEGR